MRHDVRSAENQNHLEIELEDSDIEELDPHTLDSTMLDSAQRVIAPERAQPRRPSSVPPPIPRTGARPARGRQRPERASRDL